MKINLIKLKIKAKHLAVEPAIIRKECEKLQGMAKWELQHHIKTVIRPEARATQLAIAYIKQRPYSSVEKGRKPEKEYEFISVKRRVLAMVQKYDRRSTTLGDIEKWLLS